MTASRMPLAVDDADRVDQAIGARAESTEYGMRELELTDPDVNRLRIGSPPLAE